MGLINEQQRKNADQQEPVVKPIQAVTPVSSNNEEIQAFPNAETLDTETPATTLASSPLASLNEFVGNKNTEVAPLSAPEIPQSSLPALAPVSPIFNDVSKQNLSPYSLAVVNSTLPTVYQTTPDFKGRQAEGQALVNQGILRYNEQQQRQLAEANKLQQRIAERGRNPNVTDIDKPWYQTDVSGWVNDVLYGNEQAKKRTEAGNYNPLVGEFGRQGAGLGGLLKYVLNTGQNAVAGASAETNKLVANTLEFAGVSKTNAENFARNGFLGFLPDNIRILNSYIPGSDKLTVGSLKPYNIVGFNWDEANKRNLLLDAFAGNDVGDFNDPKQSTELGTGRVYYREQRKLGQQWYEDPVGASLQIGSYLFNPGDVPIDHAVSYGVSKLFGRTAKVTQEASKVSEYTNKPRLGTGQQRIYKSEVVEPSVKLSTDTNAITTTTSTPELNPPRLGYGQAYVVKPELPSAANPTKVVRVPVGETSVNQRLLPPAIDSNLVPTNKLTPILPTSSPAHTALKVGIGTPSITPITDIGELELRPYRQMIEQIVLTNPKLLEGYKGVSWQELKNHLQNTPNLDYSQFNVIGKQLPPSVSEESVHIAEETATKQELPSDSFSKEKSIELADMYEYTRDKPKFALVSAKRIISDVKVSPEEINAAYEAAKKTGGLTQPVVLTPVDVDNYGNLVYKVVENHAGYEAAKLLKRDDPSKFEYVNTVVVHPESLDDSFFVGKPKQTSLASPYLQTLQSIGAKTNDATDLEEVASLVQEIATKQGLKQSEINLQEILPKAVEEFNKGKKIALNTSTINKAISIKEFESYGYNVEALRNKVTEKGIRLKPNEDPRIVDIINQELITNKWKDTVGTLQKLYDEGNIRVFDKPEDIPKITAKDIQKATQNPTIDDKLQALEELASQKQTIQAPLRQLDEYFDTSVDFGRRELNDIEHKATTTDEVLNTLTNGGTPNLHPRISETVGKEIADALLSGDMGYIAKQAALTGEFPIQQVSRAVDAHNAILSNPVSIEQAIQPTKALTQAPDILYHGTALANWKPGYNLSEFGSRGELGHGLYLTKDASIAEDYARATVGKNASPATLDSNLSPAVYSLFNALETTLDARAKLPSNDELWSELLQGLPDKLQTTVKKSLARAKNATYTSLLNKVESSMVKAGIEPSEQVLQDTQRIISDNLRKLGYDSVHDSKSGFTMALDGKKVSGVEGYSVKPPTTSEAVLARYNADAHAAKHFPDRLSTDANLRDSTYQLHTHQNERIDGKMKQLQQEVMQKLSQDEYDGVLSKLPSANDTKPKTIQEALDELPDVEDICNI